MNPLLPTDRLTVCLCLTQARTADFPMMAAACGYDAIYIDLEHTPTSLETTSMLCVSALACGLTPFVRVPAHDHQYLTRALDGGAIGVIVPHVETPAQAQAIVQAGRFPSRGRRSITGPNPVTTYKQMASTELIAELEARTILCAMIESPLGVENAEAIAGTPGLDMVMLGPYDLTAEMGILGQLHHPEFLQAAEQVARACRNHGKVFGIAGIKDEALLRRFIDLGLRFVSAGTDTGFFMEAARAGAANLRKLPVR